MAGIDKTYTNSWLEYQEFKNWANDKVVVFFNGHKEYVRDYLYHPLETYFDGQYKVPIMNSPTWLDIYLIQNCKIQFVLDRLKNVYGENTYDNFLTIDLSAKPPIEYQQNRKIIIKKTNKTKFPIHNKPYDCKNWWLQCNDDFWFDKKSNFWTNVDFYYSWNTNTAFFGSLKAIVRHLRKQYLPNGICFRITGNYVGENYEILIK